MLVLQWLQGVVGHSVKWMFVDSQTELFCMSPIDSYTVCLNIVRKKFGASAEFLYWQTIK